MALPAKEVAILNSEFVETLLRCTEERGVSQKFVRYGTNGEGTCFYHSLLAAINPPVDVITNFAESCTACQRGGSTENLMEKPPIVGKQWLDHSSASSQCYRDVSPKQQRELGQQFRKSLTCYLNRDALKRSPTKVIERGTRLDFSRLTKDVCSPSTWADQTAIQFVGHVLKLDIVFLDMSDKTTYCGVRGHLDQPMVIIAWVDKSHFEAVLHETDGGTYKGIFEPRTIVPRCIHRLYTGFCSG